jgi:hypothetical protein
MRVVGVIDSHFSERGVVGLGRLAKKARFLRGSNYVLLSSYFLALARSTKPIFLCNLDANLVFNLHGPLEPAQMLINSLIFVPHPAHIQSQLLFASQSLTKSFGTPFWISLGPVKNSSKHAELTYTSWAYTFSVEVNFKQITFLRAMAIKGQEDSNPAGCNRS